MKINPVADMIEEFQRLSSVEHEVIACNTDHWTWENEYKDEMDATLKQKLFKMWAYLRVYQLDMDVKILAV